MVYEGFWGKHSNNKTIKGFDTIEVNLVLLIILVRLLLMLSERLLRRK